MKVQKIDHSAQYRQIRCDKVWAYLEPGSSLTFEDLLKQMGCVADTWLLQMYEDFHVVAEVARPMAEAYQACSGLPLDLRAVVSALKHMGEIASRAYVDAKEEPARQQAITDFLEHAFADFLTQARECTPIELSPAARAAAQGWQKRYAGLVPTFGKISADERTIRDIEDAAFALGLILDAGPFANMPSPVTDTAVGLFKRMAGRYFLGKEETMKEVSDYAWESPHAFWYLKVPQTFAESLQHVVERSTEWRAMVDGSSQESQIFFKC